MLQKTGYSTFPYPTSRVHPFLLGSLPNVKRRDENRQSTLLVSQARRLAHEFLEIRVVATALVSRWRVSEKHLPPTKVGNTQGKVLPWEYGHTLMVLRKCQTSALFIRKFLIHPLVPWRAWGDPLFCDYKLFPYGLEISVSCSRCPAPNAEVWLPELHWFRKRDCIIIVRALKFVYYL